MPTTSKSHSVTQSPRGPDGAATEASEVTGPGLGGPCYESRTPPAPAECVVLPPRPSCQRGASWGPLPGPRAPGAGGDAEALGAQETQGAGQGLRQELPPGSRAERAKRRGQLGPEEPVSWVAGGAHVTDVPAGVSGGFTLGHLGPRKELQVTAERTHGRSAPSTRTAGASFQEAGTAPPAVSWPRHGATLALPGPQLLSLSGSCSRRHRAARRGQRGPRAAPFS